MQGDIYETGLLVLSSIAAVPTSKLTHLSAKLHIAPREERLTPFVYPAEPPIVVRGEMGAGEDFEVILEEIWGSGKYQKRLTLVLLGNLFFLMPFALLVQMFVLHIPGKCR